MSYPMRKSHDMSDTKEILVGLLAAADAAFLTYRGKFRQRPAQVRHEQQTAWLAGGLPLRSHGGSGAERKDFEIAVRQLEAAGLLAVRRGDAGRRTAAKLTPNGEAVARRLAGSFTLSDQWELLERLGEMSQAVDGRMIAEHIIIGIRRWKGTPEQNKQLGALEWQLLPLLTAGYVTGATDTLCRYWYAITPAGRRALEAGPPEPPPDDLQMDDQLAEFYDEVRAAIDEAVATAIPEQPNNLVIPLSAGIGWGVAPKELEQWTT